MRSTGKIALVSLRFRPAFLSYLRALGKTCQELGFGVEFVVDHAYTQFPDLGAVAPLAVYSKELPIKPYRYAVFVNVSLQNWKVASALKRCGAKVLYVYHDPWRSAGNLFQAEGIRRGLKAALAHLVSVPILKLADTVILPSRYGAQVYGQADIRYNRNAVYLPLLFDDEANGCLPEEPGGRQYFSYIGGICRARGFDQYVRFARESLARGSPLKFMIASSYPLPRYVLSDPVIRRHLDCIQIHCGRPLPNAEINQCYAESLCVWNLYRRSTQSGVLPKAFMFGVPVIARHTGAFTEFVQDGFNGRFASFDDYAEIEAAIGDIAEHLPEYTKNCRQSFLQKFFYRSNLGQVQQAL